MKLQAYKSIVKVLSLVSFSFFLFSFSACELERQMKLEVYKKKPITYAIYMAADNNLEEYAIQNLNALKQVGSDENVNFVVLIDRSPKYDTSNKNWNDTKLLYLTKGHSLNYDIVNNYDPGELDMTDSDNLFQFLRLVQTYYPSDTLILNIWSHGYGVYHDGTIHDVAQKGIGADETTSKNATMSIVDLKKALYSSFRFARKKIDVLQFDACDMQLLEVAYEIKKYVKYIVGAENEIPSGGSNYKDIAEYLCKNPTATGEKIASYMVDSYAQYYKNTDVSYSYGAIKTSYINDTVELLNKIVSEALNDYMLDLPYGRTILEQFLNDRPYFSHLDESFLEYCDLYEMMSFFVEKFNHNSYANKNNIENLGLTQSSLDEMFKKLIVNYATSKDLRKTHSLGINMPYTISQFVKYRQKFSIDTLLLYQDTELEKLIWMVRSYYVKP